MFCDYIVGLDLGQTFDYTAIAILQEPVYVIKEVADHALHLDGAAGWLAPDTLSRGQREQARAHEQQYGRPEKPVLDLRHMERLRGLPYPRIVDRVVALLQTPPLSEGQVALVVDQTGVGRGVFDLFKERGIAAIGVTITAGQNVTTAPDGGLRVPKIDLIGAVDIVLTTERLRVPRTLTEGETLAQELRTFRRRSTPSGSDQFSSWREADHDDEVLALALALWWRDWYHAHLDAAAQRRQPARAG